MAEAQPAQALGREATSQDAGMRARTGRPRRRMQALGPGLRVGDRALATAVGTGPLRMRVSQSL